MNNFLHICIFLFCLLKEPTVTKVLKATEMNSDVTNVTEQVGETGMVSWSFRRPVERVKGLSSDFAFWLKNKGVKKNPKCEYSRLPCLQVA